MREGKRKPGDIRPIKIERQFLKYAEGSVLIECGNTKVICSATLEQGVPEFLNNTGSGWITAEYSMLPRATRNRSERERLPHRLRGRTAEIQRLIGRVLRGVTDLYTFGGHTIRIDCDVIQADGGTRTACITGGFIALVDALDYMNRQTLLSGSPLIDFVAAISIGMIDGEILIDLSFEEDAKAEVDMTLAMTERGDIIEIQGTAERRPFSPGILNNMMDLGKKGIERLIEEQKRVLSDIDTDLFKC